MEREREGGRREMRTQEERTFHDHDMPKNAIMGRQLF